MKTYIPLLLVLAVAFSSCSTAYKNTQTPDDVYYSPTRPQDEYVRIEKREDRGYRQETSDTYYEDRYLRMRVRDRYRWSALDDFYFNNTYAYNYYGYSNNWNNPWNNYYAWNNYYNPYYYGGYYGGHFGGNYYGGGIKYPINTVRPSRPVAFNPNSYGNSPSRPANARAQGSNYSQYNNRNNSYNSNRNNTGYRYNNSNSSSSRSNNSSYTPPANNNNNNSTNTPTRSYTPPASSSSSSSSGSSSGGSSGGGRPPR